jgi:hypothetical protein
MFVVSAVPVHPNANAVVSRKKQINNSLIFHFVKNPLAGIKRGDS